MAIEKQLSIHDGVFGQINPTDPETLKKGDLLLWYEDELNWGIAIFDWYSVDGGIYSTDKGGIIDSHIIGIVNKKYIEQ